MDANKRKVLIDIGYKIQPCCGLCKHSVFPNGNWGGCNIQTYDHLKHSDSRRQLSIHKFGTCPKFELDEIKKADLGKFDEFGPESDEERVKKPYSGS